MEVFSSDIAEIKKKELHHLNLALGCAWPRAWFGAGMAANQLLGALFLAQNPNNRHAAHHSLRVPTVQGFRHNLMAIRAIHTALLFADVQLGGAKLVAHLDIEGAPLKNLSLSIQDNSTAAQPILVKIGISKEGGLAQQFRNICVNTYIE